MGCTSEPLNHRAIFFLLRDIFGHQNWSKHLRFFKQFGDDSGRTSRSVACWRNVTFGETWSIETQSFSHVPENVIVSFFRSVPSGFRFRIHVSPLFVSFFMYLVRLHYMSCIRQSLNNTWLTHISHRNNTTVQ